MLAGTIVTHATTPTRKRGKGFVPTKNGTGVYRVTWNRNAEFIGGSAILMKPAGEAVFLAAPIYTAGANYVEFRVENSSGAATNAAATDEIAFVLALQTVRGLPTV